MDFKPPFLFMSEHYNNNKFVCDVYSVSDKCYKFYHGLTSLINNMKSISYSFEFTTPYREYILKDNVVILYEIFAGEETKIIYISLTRDVNLLIQYFFYMSIEHKDFNLLKYLISNHINNVNRKEIFKICNYCQVNPLKYIILECKELSLKKLSRDIVKDIYSSTNDLFIPRELCEYIENNITLNEIFYNEKPRIRQPPMKSDFNELIKENYSLSKILYKRLNAIGITEYKYKYCKSRDCDCKYFKQKEIRINRILYCEVTSYKYLNKKPKYAAITFHQYDSMFYNPHASYIPIETHTIITCKFIKRIPKFTDYSFKRPFRFSITHGIYESFNSKLENELFTIPNMRNKWYCPKDPYKINFSLLKRNTRFMKKFKYYSGKYINKTY